MAYEVTLTGALRRSAVAGLLLVCLGGVAVAQTQDAYFQPFLEGTAPERSFTDQTTTDQSRQAARDDIF